MFGPLFFLYFFSIFFLSLRMVSFFNFHSCGLVASLYTNRFFLIMKGIFVAAAAVVFIYPQFIILVCPPGSPIEPLLEFPIIISVFLF